MTNIINNVLTKDGSQTFFNEEFKEHYHSLSGAVEEAFEKHAKPSGVEELAKKGKITLIDFCFGLGYNSAAAIDLILAKNPDCIIEIFALENDKELLKKLINLKPSFKSWSIILELAKRLDYKKGNITIHLILGDAKTTIEQINKQADIVFFDPFSPKVCPQLWDEETFKKVYPKMSHGAKLTTYSCAKKVRENLKLAGFKVIDGPIIGRKAPSTIAIKE